MKPREFFYTVEPIKKRVSKKEFEKFLEEYPRRLTYDCSGISTPPAISYNDFELANRWPYSVVANTWVYSDDPEHYYYDKNPAFYIMENYEEVFNSKTGNKAEDQNYDETKTETETNTEKFVIKEICKITVKSGDKILYEENRCKE